MSDSTIHTDDTRRVLLVVDHLDGGVFDGFLPGTSLTVLPLGLVPTLYEHSLRPWLDRLGAAVFPTEQVSDKASAKLREMYPSFSAEIIRSPLDGGPSLLETLDLEEGSAWWLTDTAEKSSLRTPFINHLYNLMILDAVLAREPWDNVRLSLLDASLQRCIALGLRERGLPVSLLSTKRPPFSARRWLAQASLGSFWLRFFVVRVLWCIRTFGSRLALHLLRIRAAPDGPAPSALIFSRYPVLYASPYTAVPIERNLADLLEPLRKECPVWWVVLLSGWPWKLMLHASGVKLALERAQIVPLLLHNTLWELASAWAGPSVIHRLWRCWRRRRAWRAEFGGWDVTPLWQVELTRSLTNPELPNNLLLRHAIRRIALKYRPKVVIHPCEFQPMERAIWAGLGGTETHTVAFQHATVGSNMLSYVFPKTEIAEALQGKDHLATPLPDYYLTTGDWPLALMRASGYPATRSAVVGAVRYNRLRESAAASMEEQVEFRRALNLCTGTPVVFVATPSDQGDSMALLLTLTGAIPRLGSVMTFLFKCHYHCRVESEIERLFGQVDRCYWRVLGVDADVQTCIRGSDVVLVTNSSVGLEAIALNRPPVVFDNRATLNIGPLGDLREAALFAYSPEGLAKTLTEALDPAVRARLKDAWPEALRRTFHRLDGEAPARFMAFLKDKNLL